MGYIRNPLWVNGQTGGTPIDADALNALEDGLVAAAAKADTAFAGIATVATATTAEQTRATAAEGVLTTALATEATTARAAEISKLPLAGGTMTGAITMGSHKILTLTDGSSAQDAAAFHQIADAVAAEAALRTTADGLKAPVANPTFTGVVNAVTPSDPNEDSTVVPTTQWVNAAIQAAIAAAIAGLQQPLKFSSAGLSAAKASRYEGYAGDIHVGLCSMQGTPTGADLVVLLEKSVNGGTTWTTVDTLTITNGSSTAVSHDANSTITGPVDIRCHATTVGGGTDFLFEAMITDA